MNNEIVFSDKNNSNLIASLLKKKEIRPLTRGVYTRNMQDYLREITKNKWLEITNHLYPNHCLAFRTAIELKVSPKNKIYLTGNRANKSDVNRVVFTIKKSDFSSNTEVPFFKELKTSIEPRIFL